MSDAVTVLIGDANHRLQELPTVSVHSCVTSPPYWGLRRYLPDDHPDKALEIGGEKTPEEYVESLVGVFREVRRVLRDDGTCWIVIGDSYAQARGHGHWSKGGKAEDIGLKPKDLCLIPSRLALALQADGWYVRAMIPWVKRGGMPASVADRPSTTSEVVIMLAKSPRYFFDWMSVLRPFADARQARDGATRASERNRGGRTDRFTKPNGIDPSANGGRRWRDSDVFFSSLACIQAGGEGMLVDFDEAGDPRPLALVVNPRPSKLKHYAMFPEVLVEPMLRASTPEAGACSSGSAPWHRITGRACEACGALVPTQHKSCSECGHVRDWKAGREVHEHFGENDWSTPGRGTPRLPGGFSDGAQAAVAAGAKRAGYVEASALPEPGMDRTGMSHMAYNEWLRAHPPVAGGWQPSCACLTEGGTPPEPAPACVLDPFGGALTTGVVAKRLGRHAILVELSEDYVNAGMARMAKSPT